MESEASNRPLRGSKRIKRAQIPSNSSSKIPILPEEIITEILTRLPVKSLLKFRSVSKSWLALISSPQFINTHLSLSKNKEDTHHILISGSSGAKRIFKECSISSLFYDSVTQVLDLDFPIENRIDFTVSCNGLIFLADYIKYSLLWNPTTRKHKNLPDFKPRFKKNYYVIYGFGYDEFRDDYKVVGISYGSDGVEVKVYSLKSDSWTSVDYCWEILNAPGSSQKMKLYGTGLFANGKLHWDTITSGPIMRWGRNIISFDLANEKWEKMEKPSYGVGESDLWVGKLGSDLCVYSDYRTTHLGAWVMKDYGVKESWTKMFTIRRYLLNRILSQPFFMSNKGQILAASRSASFFEICIPASRSTIIIYNSKDDSFIYPDVMNLDGCLGEEIYIESLVCPFSTEGTENATKERLKKLRSKQSSNK